MTMPISDQEIRPEQFEDLPDLTADQVETALLAARIALAEGDPNTKLNGNRSGELCVRLVWESPPKRAK